jgi:hypothetical protein
VLELLLVNHQIYYEARVLPFRNNIFNFDKPSSSGIKNCRTFLQRLHDWQIRELQHIMLAVIETDLTVDPSESSWIYLCTTLSGQEHEDAGLRHLRVTINGYLHRGGADMLDYNASWVVNGLLNMKALQSLEIVIAFSHVSARLVDRFYQDLHQALPRVSLAIRHEKTFFCTIL